MPRPRMALRMIKDVIRLKWEGNLSHEQIACALGVSKGVVSKYVGLAAAAGLDWETARDWDERQIAARILPRAAANEAVVHPDWGRVHLEMGRKGVTLMLLWEEYVASYPESRTWRYTQFCKHYKDYVRTLKRSMRQTRRAGEKLFIDFAGSTVPLTDGSRAHVFVAAMGASSYTFACATEAERLEHWVDSLVRSFEFYGGVPQLVVPDQPRAVVSQPDRHEPDVHRTLQDLAQHYGTSILPARPRKPQDKAPVESAVQVVTRWILARLRHRSFDTVAEVDRAIAELLPMLNDRPFQKLPGSRSSVFAELDRPALQLLPANRYEFARFKTVKVGPDYHVEVDKHFYSVSHALVGQELEARITMRAVEVLLRGSRVASHVRSSKKWEYTTLPEHMPASHRAHLEWTPQRLIDWGSHIGVACGEVVTRLLRQYKHPEHGYRSCLGMLSLAKRYGKDRLEAACERALVLGVCRYRHVRDLLRNNRDRLQPGPAQSDWVSPPHDNLRGPGYYQ